MATMITSCPACKKQIKIPAEVAGKKIKCKGCGTIFTATSTAVRPESPTAQPKPADPTTIQLVDDDEGDGKPYDVTTLDLTPRCPHCAYELEEEGQIICLHCGYNTETRELGRRRRTKALTGWDWFWWLLPPILSVMAFFICLAEFINIVIQFIFFRDYYYAKAVENGGDFASFFKSMYNCSVLWESVLCLFCMYWAGKYAIKRLIYNFRPPEEEIH
jgi:predicted Zn finger-like uncharacterized protein